MFCTDKRIGKSYPRKSEFFMRIGEGMNEERKTSWGGTKEDEKQRKKPTQIQQSHIWAPPGAWLIGPIGLYYISI